MALRPAAATWHRQPRGQCRCAILLVERPAYSPASLAGPGLSFCTMGVDESDHSTQLSQESLLSQGSALVPNSSRKPQAYSISIASQPPAVVGQRGLAIQRLAFRALKNDPSPLNRSADGRR
jgi:hypothetical protein